MDPKGLAHFLRTRRESLRPIEVGLAVQGVRRTPGLRREEVATEARVSVDYYERLERERAAPPSRDVVARLANALRLNLEGLDDLVQLAGLSPTTTDHIDGYVDPQMLFLLDTLTDVPAWVIDEATTVVARNRLGRVLFPVTPRMTTWQSNMAWHWFTGQHLQAMLNPENKDDIEQALAAELRIAAAWSTGSDTISRLVADLSTASAAFAERWTRTDIKNLRRMRVSLTHPVAGPLDLNTELLYGQFTRQRLLTLRPEPGTGTTERLSKLKDNATTDLQGSGSLLRPYR